MSKEDRYGLFGAIFCTGLAYFDDWWRSFWIVCAVALTAWTIASLWSRSRS